MSCHVIPKKWLRGQRKLVTIEALQRPVYHLAHYIVEPPASRDSAPIRWLRKLRHTFLAVLVLIGVTRERWRASSICALGLRSQAHLGLAAPETCSGRRTG